MYVRQFLILLFLSLLAPIVVDPAQGQHFDILLARPVTGTRTIIGGADVDALAYDDATRVFEVELGAAGGEFLALEPGVNHPNLNNPVSTYPSTAAGLQTGDVLRLVERDFLVDGIVDDLFYWNGTGAVSFTPASADFRIDGGGPLPGNAGAGGAFDDHPFLVVDSDALSGIYLASVFGSVDGFDQSDPVYLVMATGEEFEDVHELAAEYVQAHLVVPEPTSLWLVTISSGAILATRRAKRSIGFMR